MEPKLFKYVTGFRSKHNTQHALLIMIEGSRATLSKDYKVVAITMHLTC